MRIQTLRSWTEFDRLSSEWNGLLERSRAKSVFLTWEWIRCWRDAIDDAVQPYVIVVRNSDGELIGVAPLYVASLKLLNLFNFRTLRYLADIGTGAEYPDWIVERDCEDAVCDAIAGHLHDSRNEWDTIWLSSVAGWTGADARIHSAAMRNGLSVRGRDCGFVHIELPSELREFENTFSAKSRQRMRRTKRRVLESDGVEVIQCESEDSLPDWLTELFRLHQTRWKSTGIDGSFERQPVVETFYRKIAPIAMKNGWLRLFALKQGDAIMAAQFGYVFDGSYHQIQEGYDPEFQAGAGNALRHRVIEECLAQGIRHYDFLAGVSEHKRRWGGAVRHGFDYLIGNSSLRSRLIFLTGMWPTGRFMQQMGLVTGAKAQ